MRKEQVRAHLRECVSETQDGESQCFRHADVSVGVQQALDARGDRKSIPLDFTNGRTERWSKVSSQYDEFQIHVLVFGQVLQGPIEMTVVRT